MKKKVEDKSAQKVHQAIYKFKFSKEQKKDLQTAFNIFDKDGTGNIDIKDLKVILNALGFEPQEDEIKKLLSSINRSDEEEYNKKGFSAHTIDWNEFLSIMSAKLAESEEIQHLKVGFHNFSDQKKEGNIKYITLNSLREMSKTLGEEMRDEELKEMMIEANPSLKSHLEAGKDDDDDLFRISQEQFNELLDKIKSGS
jgi:centrin-1